MRIDFMKFIALSQAFCRVMLFVLIAGASAVSSELLAQKLENPTKLYRGIVLMTGSDEPAHEGLISVYEEPYPEPVTSSRINTGTGDYSMILDPSKIYRFKVEAIGCYTSEFIISTPGGTNYEELDENFEVSPIPADSILYNGKPFVTGEASFSDEAGIQQVLTFLQVNSSVIVSIGVGLEKDAVDPVSKKRVEALKVKFREMNVSTTRIKWVRMVGDELGLIRISVADFELEG